MPLFWLSLAFLLGILSGAMLTAPTVTWLGLAGASLLMWLAARAVQGFIIQSAWWQTTARRLTAYQSQTLGNRFGWLAPILRSEFRLPSIFLILCCLLTGAARYQASQLVLSSDHIAWYNGQASQFIIEGVLVEPPDVRDQFTYLHVQVDQLHPRGDPHFQPVHGLLLARVAPGGSWQYGDRVRLEGYLTQPQSSESFSYQEYLARQDIFSVMNNAQGVTLLRDQGSPWLKGIFAFRDTAQERILQFFPDPEASLLAGILLGVRTGIAQDVNEAFRLTGTSHIIAISGFNITLLSGMFLFVFRRVFGRWRGAAVTAVVIIFYTIMVGASAAVVRAAILAVLGLFGREIGRRQMGLNSLAIVAALMSLHQPGVLWDIGFQLSFAATLGLILYADPFLGSFHALAGKMLPAERIKSISGFVGAYFLFTLAAQVTTLPLILHYTGDLSLTALAANPLILPAQPPVMILGGLATLMGMVSSLLGQWIAYLAWPFLAFTIRTVEWLATIPGSVLHLDRLEMPGLLLYYAALFGWTTYRWMKREVEAQPGSENPGIQAQEVKGVLQNAWQALKAHPWLPLLGLVIITLLTWRQGLSSPDRNLHATILNVGSGEAIVLQTPGGRNVLINGGPSGLALADALGRRMPSGQRQFDWWVIANGDEESVAGLLPVLNRYPPEQVLWAGATHGTYASRQLWEALKQSHLPVTLAESGQALDLGMGGRLEVLYANPRGAVLRLTWDNFSLLLPLGSSFDALEYLDGKIPPVSALLLADSGFAPLNPPEWIEQLRPEVVLLSVAADDYQGLPDEEVIAAIKGVTLLRTDVNGWIELTTDGEQLWVEVESWTPIPGD